jgi:GTP-binding protein
MNYYLVNGEYYFVDLPGYGYARLPEQIRSSWGKLIEQYLKTRTQLALVLQLVDARHEPTELDMMMVGWLDYYEIPFLIALTKADKLPSSKMPRIVQTARDTFSQFSYCREVLPFSSVSGLGKTEVVKIIGDHLQTPQAEKHKIASR